MKINWKVRLQSKAFWAALISAVLVLIQVVAAVFGFNFDLSALGDKLLAVLNAIFVILMVLGVVVDPTTPGTRDSQRALTYTKPGVSEDSVSMNNSVTSAEVTDTKADIKDKTTEVNDK